MARIHVFKQPISTKISFISRHPFSNENLSEDEKRQKWYFMSTAGIELTEKNHDYLVLIDDVRLLSWKSKHIFEWEFRY